MKKKSQNFKKRLMTMFVAILVVLVASITAIMVKEIRESVMELLLTQAQDKASYAAGEVGLIYNNEDENQVESLQKFVDKTMKNRKGKVAYCVIIDENCKAIAHSDNEKLGKVYTDDYTVDAVNNGKSQSMKFFADVQGYWTYDVMVPVMVDGVQKGCLDMGMPITGVKQFINEKKTIFFIVSM